MTINPQYLEFGGQQLVVLSVTDFEALSRKADVGEPAFPPKNDDGTYPASAIAIITARDIIRTRRGLGLSQAELAKLAGVRLDTIQRIELGTNSPNVRTMTKIDDALKRAERKKRKPKSK